MNKVLEWFTNLVYLNVLWVIFCILGLGIFGVFPAIAATFSVTHNWLTKRTDVPIFKTFWFTYKKQFIRSNLLGYLLLIIGLILYIDILVFNSSTNAILNLLTIPLIAFFFVYIMAMFYVFPALIYYDIKLFHVVKNAFFVMILNPLPTIFMLVGILVVSSFVFQFQALIPILGMSLFSVAIMMPALRAFEMINKKQENKVPKSI
ncbi:MAG: YesL family protein [Anaerobacillus sp.]|uniref:YesL family protein n=1 Tax=Anaerobacillus sp. TaxID=1872506 RepID=UPI00391A1E4C